jgi:hypothetical protein
MEDLVLLPFLFLTARLATPMDFHHEKPPKAELSTSASKVVAVIVALLYGNEMHVRR